MRVRVIFVLRNRGAVLPFYHQQIFSEYIDSLVANSEVGESGLYNFSGLKGQTRVSRKGLHFCSRRVTLVFSCHNKKMIDFLLMKIFSQDAVRLGDLELEPESVEMEKMPDLQEVNKFICISPMVIAGLHLRRDPKEFIMPNIDKFSDLLYESTMNRMERSGFYTPEDISSFYKFQLIPDRRYLERVQQEDKKFARIYEVKHNKQAQEVRGYTFPFILYAHPKVQQFIFKNGLGEFTAQGFGMLDLAHSDPTQRTEVYTGFQQQQTQEEKTVNNRMKQVEDRLDAFEKTMTQKENKQEQKEQIPQKQVITAQEARTGSGRALTNGSESGNGQAGN
ncbi:MAG: CRISPR-associated endoribonuclease Cas6 [Bernardetiaceae bacterium]|nr:CRISPR-associated endoribonuclease Cas6 [Bernardetiaceae bacterium]